MRSIDKVTSLFLLLTFITCINGHKTIYSRHISKYGKRPSRPDSSSDDTLDAQTKYFKQKLDNFNKSNTATWGQRYHVKVAQYVDGGPIFIMIGGEYEIDISQMTSGQWYLNAQKFHALMFQLEHRFYGYSPPPTMDTSIDNLRYLTSRQALADLEAFIKGMKKEYNIPKAKVILFGGSYGGNLAVWHRQLYPDTTVGAVASSAPVLAIENYFGYLETVGEAIKSISVDCYNTIEEAFKGIQTLIKTKDIDQLNSLIDICNDTSLNYSDPNEISLLYDNLIDSFLTAVQDNTLGNNSTLVSYCQTLTNRSYGDALSRFGRWYEIHVDECLDHDYEGVIDGYKMTEWYSDQVLNGDRQWNWQRCTEFGNFLTTDGKNQPFGQILSLKYEIKYTCEDTFGISPEKITRAIEKSNNQYKGQSPNVTNVYFLNGSLDPWHRLSVLNSTLTSPSRLIKGTSHCYDMYENDNADSQALIDARKDVSAVLSRWLKLSNIDLTADDK